jgi:hypothetical protein
MWIDIVDSSAEEDDGVPMATVMTGMHERVHVAGYGFLPRRD